jgi:hypothetical protein
MSKLFGESARLETDADLEDDGVSWLGVMAASAPLVDGGVVNVVGESLGETDSCAVGVASVEGRVMDVACDGGCLTALATLAASPDIRRTLGGAGGDVLAFVCARGSIAAVETGVTTDGFMSLDPSSCSRASTSG